MIGRRSPATAAVALAGLLLVAGCALGASSFATLPTRAAGDVPEQWRSETPAGDRPACPSPLLDARHGTRILLERSGTVEASAGSRFDPTGGPDPGGRLVGDYRVPDDRYGVRANELLRVDCRTGRTIGIVPR